MRSRFMARRRVAAGLVATTMVLAACGGGDDANDTGAGDALPQVDEAVDEGDAAAAPSAEAEGESSAADPPAADAGDDAPTGDTSVDLVGADVRPESDIAENLLPSVVVDDLNTGRKVNFKNLVPQDKPILLWMWAPH